MYLFNLIECLTPRVNHNVNYEFLVNMIREYRYNYKKIKCYSLVDVDNKIVYAHMGQRLYWQFICKDLVNTFFLHTNKLNLRNIWMAIERSPCLN